MPAPFERQRGARYQFRSKSDPHPGFSRQTSTGAGREKNMDSKDVEHLMRVLQAHTVALCALLTTHPDHPTLRAAFETIAFRTAADPQTLEVLRKSIR
jgi:hypothetical protein